MDSRASNSRITSLSGRLQAIEAKVPKIEADFSQKTPQQIYGTSILDGGGKGWRRKDVNTGRIPHGTAVIVGVCVCDQCRA